MQNSEQSNIHEFDFALICEYFSSLRRQGPGSEQATLRALQSILPISSQAKVADVGCGTGSSTLVLARTTGAHITAVDLFPDFLRQLEANARTEGLSAHISTLKADMGCLPFGQEELDVIWCEGAIYNVGFRRGLSHWHPLLCHGGYIAVSEATWLKPQQPKEIAQFWHEAYPEISDMATNLATMEDCGYQVVDHFVLPEACWTTHFYEPARHAQECFLARHPNDVTAQRLVANQRREALLYQRYKDYYGYVFYIGQKA